MESRERTRRLILEHFARYPEAQIGDLFKFLHQSSFGCEHLVKSLDIARARIETEYNTLTPNNSPLVESLDGEYSRINLAYLGEGLSAETFSKLFFLSAKTELNGSAAIEEKLDVAQTLVCDASLPIDAEEFRTAREEWKANGYPALHHSDSFRSAYAPSYRVISNRFVPFLPLFAKLDRELKEKPIILAVEGGSASGKSTLGEILDSVYGCTVFHMDDYFLPPEKRTKERFDEIGGNIDHERFFAEILSPLSKGEQEITYKKFDCSTMSLCEPTTVTPSRLTVIEGAYSMHPTLCEKYNTSVFLDISPEKQRERIKKRNSPQFAKRFFEEWMPLEEKYFTSLSIKEKCDIVIEI